LSGYPSLFPDAIAAWDAQLQSTKESVAMAVALADFDDIKLPDQDEAWLEERVAVLLADLVEPAKAMGLEKLGEGERGLRMHTDWLRPNLCCGHDLGFARSRWSMPAIPGGDLPSVAAGP
jgi:hypothetical protein